MKMKQYFAVEVSKDFEVCEMLLGPVSHVDAWNCMRKFQYEYPFRYFDVVTRLIEVED